MSAMLRQNLLVMARREGVPVFYHQHDHTAQCGVSDCPNDRYQDGLHLFNDVVILADQPLGGGYNPLIERGKAEDTLDVKPELAAAIDALALNDDALEAFRTAFHDAHDSDRVAAGLLGIASWLRVDDVPMHDQAIIDSLAEKGSDQRPGNLGEVIDRRVQVYGNPVETFPRVAEIWSGITGHLINATDVPLMMIGYKLLRANQMPDYSDNIDDVDGYADIFRQLVGEDMIVARSVNDFIAQKWPNG